MNSKGSNEHLVASRVVDKESFSTVERLREFCQLCPLTVLNTHLSERDSEIKLKPGCCFRMSACLYDQCTAL